LGAFFGLLDSVPRRGLDYFLFKFIGESTPKLKDFETEAGFISL
jgi:hypothetical protein